MSDDLDVVRARRAERKAEVAKATAAQEAIDLAAIDELEIEHGDSNVCVVRVPYTPGLPVLVAGKCPEPKYVKRYQARIKPNKDGKPGDAIAATEELADVVLLYPEKEVYDQIRTLRPIVHLQLGTAAAGLATGKIEVDSKD